MIAQRSLATVFEADSYDGYIIESLQKDKSILLTVYLEVHSMPFALRDLYTGEWFFEGVMDYTYEAHFVLEKHIPGGEMLDWDYGDLVTDNKGQPAPLIVSSGKIPSGPRVLGDFLPVWWLLYFYPYLIGGHYVYEDWISEGAGYYYDDPEQIMYSVNHHQQAFVSDDLDVNDPDVYQWPSWSVPYGVFKDGGIIRQSPLLMPETWPYEDCIISPMN